MNDMTSKLCTNLKYFANSKNLVKIQLDEINLDYDSLNKFTDE